MRHSLLLEALVQHITCDDKLPGSVINCPVPAWHIFFFTAAKNKSHQPKFPNGMSAARTHSGKHLCKLVLPRQIAVNRTSGCPTVLV